MRSRDARATDRLWLAFAVSSVLCLAVLAVSPIKDYFRPYRHYQEAYRERLVAAADTARELRRARAETVRVRQYWIPELEDRVDRCISCHLGVENPRMADAPRPFTLHPETPHTPYDFDRFGCVSCHRGQGRATTTDDAHGPVEDWNRPLLPLRYTEASCGTCHRRQVVAEADLLSSGRELIRRAGCVGCHRFPPPAAAWTSTAPDLDGLSEKTRPGWILGWLRDPESLRPGTWMPDFRLTEEEAEALLAFLWLQPPRQVVGELAPERLPEGNYDRGRKIFRTARCISCHTVEGRGNGSAPELLGLGAKVERRWLYAYLADPHAFQPRTEMPHYRFDHLELVDLTRYLVEELVDPAAPAVDDARPDPRLADEGAELYRQYGCGGCHRLGGDEAGSPLGPDLVGIGDKPVELLDFGERDDLPHRLPAWLAAKVSEPRSFRRGLKMPVYSFGEEQVVALVTALLSQTDEEIPESYRVEEVRVSEPPPGRFGALVREFRCMSCHRIRGAGSDLSTAPLGREGSKVTLRWLEEYLVLPTTIRPILTERMIPLGMSREEASFLALIMDEIYLDDAIPGEIFPAGLPVEGVERGKRLFFRRYGCQACHQAEGSGGYYGPPLDDSAAKLESGWIAWWLRGPQRWRSDVRCPDYAMDEDDARDLAAFLLSLGNPRARSQGGAS